MLDAATPISDASPQQVAPPAPAETHMSFRSVLSALNPLQYLPVIGTIYRAITGDEIPEGLRRMGSLVVSGLIGGPVGAAINVVMLAAEKISGIDFDKTGQKLLAGLGATDHPAATPASAPAPSPVQVAGADAPTSIAAKPATPPVISVAFHGPRLVAPPAAEAWSQAQLTAYGVSTVADGTLKLANLSGADVLNSLELSRLQMAQTAYDRAGRLAA
jgi:hypothetical protein